MPAGHARRSAGFRALAVEPKLVGKKKEEHRVVGAASQGVA